MKKVIVLLALVSTAVFAQQKGTFTDPRDKKTYKTVKIGKQVWMAENLNYAAEGSKCGTNKVLCEGHGGQKPNGEWCTGRSYLLEDKNTDICNKYGRLYDWETAMKACPDGWHLPSMWDWHKLNDAVSGKDTYSKSLKAKEGWNDYKGEYGNDEGKSGNGKDSYGFSALPGGSGYSDGDFTGVGNNGNWWSSGDCDHGQAADTEIMSSKDYDIEDIGDMGCAHKEWLNSVRCVQDFKGNEELKTFYGNGKPKSVQNFKDGVPHGEHKTFYENGNLQYVQNYKDGKPHGEWKMFYGIGMSVSNYKDGKPHGEWKSFYGSGKVQSVSNYKDGAPYGEHKRFYENGNLQSVQNYKDGKPDGEHKTFYENGKPQSVINYKDGVYQSIINYEDEEKKKQAIKRGIEQYEKMAKQYNCTGDAGSKNPSCQKILQLLELQSKQLESLK
jgi:uncharacterized protein (TIGR02145 family)